MNNSITTNQPNLLRRTYAAIKAAFRFTGAGGGSGQTWSAYNWFSGYFNNSSVNFTQEAGDLVQSSLVMAAVNWLGRVLPDAPLQIVEADKNGKETPVIGHPAIDLLKRPNPYYGGANLWKGFALGWITPGDVYFYKMRNRLGLVYQLWYLPSDMITPIWPEDGSEFISRYEYRPDGRIAQIDPDDIIHFRNGLDPKTQGRTGLSPVASVLREVCADNEVPLYHWLLLKAGGAPPVVLSLKDGQAGVEFNAAEIKSKYIAATSGDQRGKVFVSGNAVELTKVGFSPSEMDLKMLRHLPESRFASVIGIAKETLGFGVADTSSTYNNVTSADARSIQTYVRPLWSYIEDELTHQLGPDFGLKPNQRFDFDLSEIAALQEDRNELFTRETLAYEKGVKKRSEAREALGLDSGPQDEVYFVLSAEEQKALEPEPPPLQLGVGEMPAQLVNGRDKTERVN